MNEDKQTIKTQDLLKVFLRSFLIQASWSFDRMQSLGFAYAIQPLLQRLYPDQDEYRSRLGLHMEYFNTQPYLAAFILGAAAKMEQERASGLNRAVDIQGLKSTLMAPLGALGDSFFWGALRPLAAVIAVALLMAGAWWAPLLFLVLYNLWHVGLRAGVFVWGYRSSGDAVALMARYSFTKWARLFKAVSLAVIGGMLGMAALWRPELSLTVFLPRSVDAVAALVITLVLVALLRKGGSPVKLMLGLVGVCLALAYAGVRL
jgi:mannose/fructose/N-acetylgalactosamine-specific phosphotransferase system component IID